MVPSVLDMVTPRESSVSPFTSPSAFQVSSTRASPYIVSLLSTVTVTLFLVALQDTDTLYSASPYSPPYVAVATTVEFSHFQLPRVAEAADVVPFTYVAVTLTSLSP